MKASCSVRPATPKSAWIAAFLLLANVSGISVASAATLLQQDFSSSLLLSSYISGTPGIGQWDQITAQSPSTVTITAGGLSFSRSGTDLSFSRTTNFSPTPSAMIYKFDLNVTPASISGSDNVLRVGSGFSTANAEEIDADTYGKLGFRITTNAPGGFFLRDIVGGASSVIYGGTQSITWVLNNSGATLSYLAPDASVQTVANDRMDVWVGTASVFDEINVTTASQSMNDLKFYFNSAGASTVAFDNFDIRSFGALSLSESHANVSCNGASDGSITATFSGGTSPYQARVDAGSFAAATSPQLLGGVAAGTHSVTVADADGAAKNLTGISITQPSALALSNGSTDVTCVGGSNGSITATYSGGTPPYTIELDGGGFASGTSPTTFNSVGAGPHTVIVKDANNCQISQPVTVNVTPSSFSIAASAGAGGSISPSGSVPVNCGTDQAFTITADPCYTVADVLVDGVSVGAVTSYTFTNVQAAHTIAASFALNDHSIDATAGVGGSISPSGNTVVNCGSDRAFTLSPDACYSVADVLVDGVSVGAVSDYTFTDVQADHTIEASFTLNTFAIAASAGAGGSISPSGNTAVNCGSDQAFIITADACYSIADVLVDGVSVGAVGDYTFTDVQTTHTIEASFGRNTFSIAYSAGAGGSIDPSDFTASRSGKDRTAGDPIPSVPVDCGTDQEFTITADPCYSVADVLVDGVSVGAVSDYTFTDVQTTHTIEASFALNTFTIAASAGAGGSISPSGSTAANCSSDQAYTITADPCYSIGDVLVDGVSVGAVSAYTFNDVQTTHTIEASFSLDSFTITASAGANGAISPSGGTAVNCGGDQTFTIAPDACYSVADVLVDGVSVGAVSDYTFTGVQAAHSIEASFGLNTFSIAYSAGAGGSIVPSGFTASRAGHDRTAGDPIPSVPVDCGTDQEFTITADACHSIADVLVDGVSVGAVGSYTFTDVQAAHTIEASFTVNTLTITASAGANGAISPSGGVSVECGSDQEFTVTPDAGFSIADVLVDGVSVGAASGYTFTDVQAAHTIAASFVDDLGPAVQVTAPNSGGNWNVGASQSVFWTAVDPSGVASVDIHVSRDNGATWDPIATAMANTGGYDWTVTSPGTNPAAAQTFTALIRVTAHDNASNTAEDQSDVAFSIFDPAVETLVAEFTAATTENGIEVHWQLSSSGSLSSVKLERSEFETGPWMAVAVESRLESGRTVALDRSVVPGRKYWYRLVATSGSGQVDVFGPVSGEAEAVTEFAITRVAPNPSRGAFHVDFAVAREARVRLSLVDIQGRELSVLASSTFRPGRYTVAWNPSDRAQTPSGVYFLRYEVGGKQWFRRVVIGR